MEIGISVNGRMIELKGKENMRVMISMWDSGWLINDRGTE
jgi:hypothetical protein